MKKLNNLDQGVLAKHKDLFLWLFVVCGIAILSIFWNTEWFRASIVKIPEKFDWTVRPVEKVPDWFNWWWDNKTTKYSIIPEGKLIDAPSYLISVWGKNIAEMTEESQEKLAKLTYAVVYLWNYNVLQRKEYTGSHPAVDIRIPEWTPILSVANGKVVKVVHGNTWFWNYIVIEMENVPDYPDTSKTETFYASYSHLSETWVQEGDIVKKWQVIWKSWNSWTSTIPHLHFQIDRKQAQWFPYWPFTSKEVYAANLNFFSAIRDGFKQENAIANTVNPMRWVEAHLDWDFNWNSSISWDESNFSNFKIIAADEFATDSRLALTIISEDKEWRVITNFKSSTDIEIGSSSSFARFSKTLRFKDWIATVMITNQKEEEFTFEIKYDWLSFKKQIESVSPRIEEDNESGNEIINSTEQVASTSHETIAHETISHETIENDDVKEDTTEEVGEKEEIKEEPKEEVKVVIPDSAWEIDESIKILFTWNQTVEAGDKLNIDIFINNLDWSFADIHRDYALDLAWVWKLNQYLLEETDFVGSKIKIQFSSEKTWNAIVSLNWTDFEIKVKEKEIIVEKEIVVEKETVVINDVSNDVSDDQHWSADEQPIIGPETKPEESNEEIFNDVSNNHKNFDAIKYLKETWVIWGYDDWTFKPNKTVTRVEAVKMIFKALKITSNWSISLPFSDTDDSAWYAQYIWAALQKGIVKGYDDWTFKPAKEVNRAEYYKILLLSSWVEIEQASEDPYSDVPASAWFWTYINYIKENKISDANWNFFPSNWVSRAEVAESIYRLVKILWL